MSVATGSVHATVRCDSGKNKTQTFSKREQFSSSVPHECPASVQPATRVYPTPCHAGRGLAGHPRSVRVGYGDNKTRLFTPIRSKTPALQRRGLHLGAGRERSRSALRGDDAAGKRSHRNGFSSFERVRLLQPLLPRPQKGWRPPAHPRSQTPESRPHETAVQDDHTEADPLADLHRGLVLFSGPERCILSHPDSPPSQTILEIRLRGSGLPVHGPTLWAVSGPPYFYEVHGRGSFPSETDGNPHSQLPRRLAHSGPVRGGTTFTQNPHPQPLRAPGAQGQFRQKRTVSQSTNIVPGYSSGLSSHESGDSARTRSGHSETRSHLQERHRSPTQSVSENAGPYGRGQAAGPLARAPETGSPFSGKRNNMAPSTRAVGSLHLAAQWEPTGFPERVLNTISEARAPSTRRLYALKWSVFSTWCLNRGENPSTSELAVVLSFLQELLDKGRSHSTLKVFVAAIAAFHAPIAGQSVGRDNSVVRFLKGARRLNPPRPLTVPTWDLPTVLRALKGPPFEPLVYGPPVTFAENCSATSTSVG